MIIETFIYLFIRFILIDLWLLKHYFIYYSL